MGKLKSVEQLWWKVCAGARDQGETHLMFGLIAITATHLFRLFQ